MEYTREIYWNIGNGMGVISLMYGLSLVAFAILAYGIVLRVRVYKQGKPPAHKIEIRRNIPVFLKNAFLQLQVLRVRGAGTFHALFFWGFFLLFIGTCLILIQADFTDPLFGVQFLKGWFYLGFSLVLDLAGLVAIVMLLGLMVRRYFFRPKGLPTQWENAVMLGLLLGILITGFVLEGARMAVTELGTTLAYWSPVGLVFANALVGIGEAGLRDLHLWTWWIHFALALGFIAMIPFTRFRHLFTTSLNYLLIDQRPKGGLVTLNMEDEQAENFGAAKVDDLSWKDIFDSDACTQCKRCQDRCPAHATDKPLSPMTVMNQIQEVAFGTPDANLVDTVSREALWSCTTCLACQESCPAKIAHVPKIVEMRRNLVLMEGEFPGEEVTTAVDQTEVNGNPLGMAFAARGDWAAGLGVTSLEEDPEVDLLYFVGCYASFDKRNIKVARNFIELCQAAGLKVGILGKEEKCCGEPVRKLGNEYLYQMLAAENIELIKGYGVKKIVTSCPHCFHTLDNDYRDLGFDLPVVHYTVLLGELLQEGRFKLKSETFDCTYHDSCYIGRYNGIFEAPRTLIQAAGGRVAEMDRSRGESFCCGAGGGRILAEEKIGTRISEKRAQMAAATGAPLLISNCPFCLTMFEDGIKGAGVDGELAPRDLAEVLAERLVRD